MTVVPLSRETAILRRLIRAGYRFRFLPHSIREMAADDIREPDATRVVEQGFVTLVETKREETWHIEGKDVDGRLIRLVVVVYAEEGVVKIVTAINLEKKGIGR